MSRSSSARSTPARPGARSVRHSQVGCRERRGTGAASTSPQDAVPSPVSAVDPLPPRQGLTPLARVAAAAALTTLDGQAVFQIIGPKEQLMPLGDLFRFRRGSRMHRPFNQEAQP
ncbi:MAG: hypothetical protein JWQ16_1533 [Novosphingobium sp.]|nr:hypothetical protein [Novosphingobium sp.]